MTIQERLCYWVIDKLTHSATEPKPHHLELMRPTCTVWKSEVGNLNVDPLRLIQSPFTWRMILLLVWQHRPRSTRTRILFGRFVSEVIRASGN